MRARLRERGAPAHAVVALAVHLLKRAQILVADVWACFGGTGLGAFNDMHRITMFADYRYAPLGGGAPMRASDPGCPVGAYSVPQVPCAGCLALVHALLG
jgi:hypothetical protein